MIAHDETKIKVLKEAGRRLAFVLEEIIQKTVPGVGGRELDELAYNLITRGGDAPAFLHYRPAGARVPYPATLCVSVNNEVVHGIPDDSVMKEGDIVGLDIGLEHEGVFVDMAKTVPVGGIDTAAKKLLRATEEALYRGIKAARAVAHVGDIGFAVESYVKKEGFSIVRELGGHGVGDKVHEDPFIPNFGKKGTGAVLAEGMVIAIEPIVNEGRADIVELKDGYTLKTKDGKRSAHFEHTVLITAGEPVIITKV